MTRKVMPSRTFKGIKFYNVKELSEILQITEYSVRSYIRNNRMPSVLVGQRLWVSEKALEDFLVVKGIRNLPDDKLLKMIHRAVELKYEEWISLAVPKMQKLVADFLKKKEEKFNKREEEFKKEMKLVYEINEHFKKILPKKSMEHTKKSMEHIRYKGAEQKKVFQKV